MWQQMLLSTYYPLSWMQDACVLISLSQQHSCTRCLHKVLCYMLMLFSWSLGQWYCIVKFVQNQCPKNCQFWVGSDIQLKSIFHFHLQFSRTIFHSEIKFWDTVHCSWVITPASFLSNDSFQKTSVFLHQPVRALKIHTNSSDQHRKDNTQMSYESCHCK